MAALKIIARNPDLQWQQDTERFWFGGCPLKSNWMNALSSVFPAVEKFFIASVRHFHEEISEPVLAAEVEAFIAQESAHRLQHKRFNDFLISYGYPIEEVHDRVTRLLTDTQQYRDKKYQLAVTCALEHFTTCLCTVVLSDARFHAPMKGEYGRLWCWHSMEELEHRTVCYDVYQHIGGSYKTRTAAMLQATMVLCPLLLGTIFTYQRHDGRQYSIKDWWIFTRWIFLWPGLIRRTLPNYLAYFRRDYHPGHIAVDDIVLQWREKLGLEK